MTTTLEYNDLVERVENVDMLRGETKVFPITHGVYASDISEAHLTVREDNADGDEVFRISSDEYPALWTHEDQYSEVEISPAITRGKTAGSHVYDVEFVLIDGTVHSPVGGVWRLKADVTYDDDDSATAQSRGTRSGFETSLAALEDFESDMLALFNATRLSEDAASGAGTITVDSVAAFSAGDTIFITLDDGTREEHDIAAGGITGTTITLDATTLGDDATEGNVVRKAP